MQTPGTPPQAEALKWLIDLEITEDSSVLNSIILNIYRMSKGIKDVQLVIDVRKKKLLVFIELRWWEYRFHKQSIINQIAEMIDEILPSYEKRVTLDRDILTKSIELVKSRGK